MINKIFKLTLVITLFITSFGTSVLALATPPPQQLTQNGTVVNVTGAGNPVGGNTTGAGNPVGGNVDPGASSPTFTLQNPLKVNSIGDAVMKGVEIFSYIVIIGGAIAFVVVGLQFILARGDVEAMKKARTWLFYIIIGIAIVLGARVIIQILINTLTASNVVKPETVQSIQNTLRK